MSATAWSSAPFGAASSFQRKAGVLGVIGIGLTVLGFLVDRTQFFTAYLIAYVCVLAFPLGAMGLLMVHTLTGGLWGWTIRPFLLAGIRTLPWMALFFLPIVLGMKELYPWTSAQVVAHDPSLI